MSVTAITNLVQRTTITSDAATIVVRSFNGQSGGGLSPEDQTKLDGIEAGADVTDAANVAAAGAVMDTYTITPGAGLAGSSAEPLVDGNLTLNVGANPDGSIVVGLNNVGVGVLATDAQHGDRGGGSLHAAATTLSSGFLSADDHDLFSPLGRQRRIVYFEDDFILNITNRWATTLSGTGAAVSQLSAAGAHPGGRLSVATGTTTTGDAFLRTNINMFYVTTIDYVHFTTIAGLLNLSDGTESYTANVCTIAPTTFGGPGWSFHYDHTLSANWLLVRWSGTGLTESVDTGVAVTASGSPPYAEQRFETVFDKAAGVLTGYINGALVATITNAFTGTSGVYLIPGRMTKRAGTTSRLMVMDYTAAVVTPAATWRK